MTIHTLLILLGCVGTSTVCAAGSTNERSKATQKPASIEALIERLGSDQLLIRQQAAADLLKRGYAARSPLKKFLLSTKNRAVRARIQGLLKTLQKQLVRDSEVHVVGLYEVSGAHHFRLVNPADDRFKWDILFTALARGSNSKQPSPAKRIWALLPKRSRELTANTALLKRVARLRLKAVKAGDIPAFGAFQTLCNDLEAVLRRRDFFDEDSFAATVLGEEGRRLKDNFKSLTLLEIWILNRRLLEAAFPKAVSKEQYALKQATVPVHIRATDRPVTLVLCSAESVIWKVIPDKGARIAKIIIAGYHLPAIKGAQQVPIAYFVYDRNRKGLHFQAWRKGTAEYKKLEEAVKKITGKPITSFQGRYSYLGGSRFVVED